MKTLSIRSAGSLRSHSVLSGQRQRPSRTPREDGIFRVLHAADAAEAFAPGGSRDWGNLVLLDGGILHQSYEAAL